MAVVAHLVESETIGRITKLQLDDEVGLLSKFILRVTLIIYSISVFIIFNINRRGSLSLPSF